MIQHALSRPGTLGPGRLICLDGPSGSGKSTLADAVAERTAAQVVHVDELLAGWDGLVGVVDTLRRLLGPLAHGADGHWRRFDWFTGRFAEWHRVRPGGVLVLEGVGSGSRPWSSWTTTTVWVEAPRAVRLSRGQQREDGMDEHWRRWQVREDDLFVRERTRSRADVVVPTHDISQLRSAPGVRLAGPPLGEGCP